MHTFIYTYKMNPLTLTFCPFHSFWLYFDVTLTGKPFSIVFSLETHHDMADNVWTAFLCHWVVFIYLISNPHCCKSMDSRSMSATELEWEWGQRVKKGERERENKLRWPAVSWWNAKIRVSIVCGSAHLTCHISACLLFLWQSPRDLEAQL